MSSLKVAYFGDDQMFDERMRGLIYSGIGSFQEVRRYAFAFKKPVEYVKKESMTLLASGNFDVCIIGYPSCRDELVALLNDNQNACIRLILRADDGRRTLTYDAPQESNSGLVRIYCLVSIEQNPSVSQRRSPDFIRRLKRMQLTLLFVSPRSVPRLGSQFIRLPQELLRELSSFL